MNITKILLEDSTTLLAFGTGLALYRRLSWFHRLLFFQVCVCVLVEIVAISVGINGWVYNIQMPVEAGFLFAAAGTCFDNKKSRYLLLLLYTFFLIVFLVDMLFFIETIYFAIHTMLVECFIMTGIYTYILYDYFLNRDTTKTKEPIILASIGIVSYFAPFVPYMSLMAYFQLLDAVINDRIFQYLVIPLSLIRYLLVALAFFFQAKKAKLMVR